MGVKHEDFEMRFSAAFNNLLLKTFTVWDLATKIKQFEQRAQLGVVSRRWIYGF